LVFIEQTPGLRPQRKRITEAALVGHSVDHAFFFVQLPAKRDSEVGFFVGVQDSVGSATRYIVAIGRTALHVSWEFYPMLMGTEAEGALDLESARRPTEH
jgi:hypothetical protein